MTKLGVLRRQLRSLRRARLTVRLATAWSALLVALLWMLCVIFLLDLVFEMSVAQRVLVLLAAGAGCLFAFAWLTSPLLRLRENELEIALLVERQQGIDSDLVAALQFESAAAGGWGSRPLREAVVDYVGQLGQGLDVFAGFSRKQMFRRAAAFCATVAVLAALAAWKPDYAATFLNRLLLGSRHYPTATTIEKIVIGQQLVLDGGTHPSATRGAEGKPLTFTILAGGQLPEREDESREVQLISLGKQTQRGKIKLIRISDKERLGLLQTAAHEIEGAIAQEDVDVSLPWINRVAAPLHFDAPAAIPHLQAAAKKRSRLAEAATAIHQAIESLEQRLRQTALYTGTGVPLVDSVSYSVTLNDAWTDWSRVALIARPVVELELTPRPPAYARQGENATATTSRQISVLQGSQVDVALRTVAGKGQTKSLREAWLVTKGANPQKLPLAKSSESDSSERWILDIKNTPFANVEAEIRFEIQVTDEDGLHLDAPLPGFIRLKADRAPSGTASIASHVVLPTAAPVVHYRGVTDDFGIAKLRLHVDVFRNSEQTVSPLVPTGESFVAPTDALDSETAKERRTIELLDQPILAGSLPHSGNYAVDLSPLELVKGDGVNVILEVVDYRGESQGVSHWGDPLPLEISDENGVKIAVLEPDEEAERQLNDIKNTFLESGESP